MLIAVFKPKADANGEGHEVWGTIHQKEVTRDQLAAHLEAGWFERASEALVEAEIGSLGRENRSLTRQVEESETVEQLKAKHGEEMDALRAQFDASWAAKLAEVDQLKAAHADEIESIRAQHRAAADLANDAPKIDGRSREARAARAAQSGETA